MASDPNFHLLSISLDPEHDRPEVLKAWLDQQKLGGENWWFLTSPDGKGDAIREWMTKTFRIAARPKKPEDLAKNPADKYEHQFVMVLVDGKGNIRTPTEKDMVYWPFHEAFDYRLVSPADPRRHRQAPRRIRRKTLAAAYLYPMGLPSKLSASAEKSLRKVVWGITALVLVLVGMMRNPKFHITLPGGVSLDFLPALYSSFNCLVAVCLIMAVIAVKQGNIASHRGFINAAMVLSGLFLLSYVAYHFTSHGNQIYRHRLDSPRILFPADFPHRPGCGEPALHSPCLSRRLGRPAGRPPAARQICFSPVVLRRYHRPGDLFDAVLMGRRITPRKRMQLPRVRPR